MSSKVLTSFDSGDVAAKGGLIGLDTYDHRSEALGNCETLAGDTKAAILLFNQSCDPFRSHRARSLVAEARVSSCAACGILTQVFIPPHIISFGVYACICAIVSDAIVEWPMYARAM